MCRGCVDLAWAPSATADINGYLIQQKTTNAEWENVNTLQSLIQGNDYSVMGLPNGTEAMFRVVGVNSAGSGQPSPATAVATISEKMGKFLKIIRTVVEEYSMKIKFIKQC